MIKITEIDTGYIKMIRAPPSLAKNGRLCSLFIKVERRKMLTWPIWTKIKPESGLNPYKHGSICIRSEVAFIAIYEQDSMNLFSAFNPLTQGAVGCHQ